MSPKPGRIATIVFTCGLCASPLVAQTSDAEGPDAQAATALEAWRAQLAGMASGAWITSNADYLDEDGGIEEYGMAYELEPGGVSSTGCLWGEQGGEVTAVYWRFFQGWDPTRGAGLIYQSNPGGLVGIGYVEEGDDGGPSLIQDFASPDGTSFRAGHYEELEGPYVRITRSVDWSGNDWIPRRTYTWRRIAGHRHPCG